MDIDYTVAALMFPAIPLMMTMYSNRFHTLSALIRQIHDQYTFEKKVPPEWENQLHVLNKRTNILKYVMGFAAFGFLSKYLFVYLLVSIDLLFIYLIFIKKDRKFDFKYLITLEVFLIALVPHLIWLNNNEFITITYGLARTGLEQSGLIDHIKYPIIFLAKQIGILIPFIFLILLLVKNVKTKFDLKDKKLLFLIAINFLPIILMFLTSIITGSKIRTMWMTPFYLFFGTLFVYLLKDQINIKKLKPFMFGFTFLFFLSPILYAYVSITKEDKRTDYPGKGIAIKTQYAWDQQFKSKINVVYGNEWNAGNLSYHLKSRPVWEGFIERKKLDQLKDYMCLDNVCVGSK